MLSWRTPSFQITDCVCRQGGQSKQPWRDRMLRFTHRRRWRRPAWGCLWSCCTSQTSTFCSAGSELWTSPSWGYFQRSHSCSPDGHKEKKKCFLSYTQNQENLQGTGGEEVSLRPGWTSLKEDTWTRSFWSGASCSPSFGSRRTGSRSARLQTPRCGSSPGQWKARTLVGQNKPLQRKRFGFFLKLCLPGKVWLTLPPCSSSSPPRWAWPRSGPPRSRCVGPPETQRAQR